MIKHLLFLAVFLLSASFLFSQAPDNYYAGGLAPKNPHPAL